MTLAVWNSTLSKNVSAPKSEEIGECYRVVPRVRYKFIYTDRDSYPMTTQLRALSANSVLLILINHVTVANCYSAHESTTATFEDDGST